MTTDNPVMSDVNVADQMEKLSAYMQLASYELGEARRIKDLHIKSNHYEDCKSALILASEAAEKLSSHFFRLANPE